MRETVFINDIQYVVLKRMRGKLLIAETREGLHRYRMQAGLSQGHMAARLGISQGALSKMEDGHLETSPEMIQKAVRILIDSCERAQQVSKK